MSRDPLEGAWQKFEKALPHGWSIAQIEYDGELYTIAARIPVNPYVGWRRGRAKTLAEAMRLLLERIDR